MSEHTENVIVAVEHIEKIEKDILETGLDLMKAADGQIYVFDHFAIATLNRGISISTAFRNLVLDFN